MKPIFISLSPNTQKDDLAIALKTLFNPFNWLEKNIKNLESQFEKRFGKDYRAYAVNSGRSAEYVILKSLGIKKGDEVLVQAFTCIAVPNSIKWLKAKPVFVDIDDTFNLDPVDLDKKITKKTKAIIVQHTFGIPARIDIIKNIAQKHNIFLIEDCAHSLGAKFKHQPLGTYSDAAFFSFGRDKIVSSVFGGMILTKNVKLGSAISHNIDTLKKSTIFFAVQQLLHPILFNLVILPLYHFGVGKVSVGKILLFVFQKAKILSKPVYRQELHTQQIDLFPRKMSTPLATLASRQFAKLDNFNAHRMTIANMYFDNLKMKKVTLPPKNTEAIWLRFPILVDDPKRILEIAKEKKILLGNWYTNIIDPKCDLENVGYRLGDCPHAEYLSKRVVNLPTYPNLDEKQVHQVISLIKHALRS
ncbi:aminotransferase class I/II-fold pyridoxal phosphate-dependent enzyme [Candidatus Woesebacteria bacterium]|nr:MAG: aminotransferase class I/II-fold pyridoxal phosphate-dependent enzyme [Candidatus Woesebacteria bacterium]